MTRLVDEIETLVESTVAGRPTGFEPVRAKRRQLVRRRYTMTAAVALVVAAIVGYTLQDGDLGHKAAPTAPIPSAVTASPTVTAVHDAGLPKLAGTVWRLDTIGNGPGAEAEGGALVPAYLFAEFRFSSDTDGVLIIGNATSPVHLAVGRVKGTVLITEGKQTPLAVSADVRDAENAVVGVTGGDVTFKYQQSGSQIMVVETDGELMHLTRLDPVGPLGRPGDKPWSVRGITGPSGPVTVDPSLNARFRLQNSTEGQFAVGANTGYASVRLTAGRLLLTPLTFTLKPAKPGELAVTRAIEALKGPTTATLTGRTLILRYATGGTLTLVSTG